MLLNKISVLDKGFVALIDSSGNAKLLQDIQDSYFKTKINMKLLDVASATLVIKCPLFVQLNLSQYGFDLIHLPSDQVEAYIPDVASVSADTLDDSRRISDYLKSTTEALLLNHKGLAMDGADQFMSQLLTPISVYNELIVSGGLKKWIAYLNQTNLPAQMTQYQVAVKDVLLGEWKNLEKLQKMFK